MYVVSHVRITRTVPVERRNSTVWMNQVASLSRFFFSFSGLTSQAPCLRSDGTTIAPLGGVGSISHS